jgi:hypothetical protein
VVGPALLSSLFLGSTWMTEKLSLAKYPAYAAYQATTSRLLPWKAGVGLDSKEGQKLVESAMAAAAAPSASAPAAAARSSRAAAAPATPVTPASAPKSPAPQRTASASASRGRSASATRSARKRS